MGRRVREVDKEKLQKAINEAEKDGPLKNLSALWEATEKIYNAMPDIPEQITISVVGLRAKQFKLMHVTVKGKKGRAKGFGNGGGKRTTKAEKIKKSKQSQKALKALKEHITEDRFAPIIERIENGSRSAAVKLKCIECMGCQPSRVKTCPVTHCALWLFRPYKEGEPNPELTVEEAIAE